MPEEGGSDAGRLFWQRLELGTRGPPSSTSRSQKGRCAHLTQDTEAPVSPASLPGEAGVSQDRGQAPHPLPPLPGSLLGAVSFLTLGRTLLTHIPGDRLQDKE